MQPLKQSTATEVDIGPAVAVGDGFTPVTTLTIAGADEKHIIKHNGTTSAVLAGTLTAYTIAVDGHYHLNLSTGETDTLGRCTIVIQDDSLILPIRHEFEVFPANVFDSIYGSDRLQVHVAEFTASIITAASINAAALNGKGDWNIGKSGYALTTADWNVGKTGYTAGPTAGSITTAAFAAGAINAAALAANMLTAAKINADAITAAKVAADVHAEAADAVWDENIVAAHGAASAAGLLLRALGAVISARTNNPTLDALLGVADSAANDVPNQILTGETMAELVQGVPDVTPTVAKALMLHYMTARNRLDVGTPIKEMYNSAGVRVATKALTDVADVYSEAKMISGV